jgi:regulatory protein
LKYLNYQARTETEVRKKLKEHAVSEDTITGVLERLKQNGLIDDARFAQAWVENRNDLHPRSRRALAWELKQRGVDPHLIEQSIQEVDDEEVAYRAALRQSRKLKDLEWQEFRQKMYGFLARRGFNYEVSAPVVSRVWAEIQDNQALENGPYDGLDNSL